MNCGRLTCYLLPASCRLLPRVLTCTLPSAAFAEDLDFEELFNACLAAEDKLEYLSV